MQEPIEPGEPPAGAAPPAAPDPVAARPLGAFTHGRGWIAVFAGAALILAIATWRLLPWDLLVRASPDTPVPGLSGTPGTAPTLQITPAEGLAGTRITAVGRGWRPGDTVFVRLQDPTTGLALSGDLASAIVTDAADFAVKFILPADPHWADSTQVLVAARDPTTGQEAAATFLRANALTPFPTPSASPMPTAALPPTAEPPVVSFTPCLACTPLATCPFCTATPHPTPTPLRTVIMLPTLVLLSPTPLPASTPADAITDWRGEYFTSRNPSGAPALVRNDLSLNFNWGYDSPGPGIPPDNFSARWTRTLNLSAGDYRFYARSDDGVRVWLDDRLLVDQWREQSAATLSAERTLDAGPHFFRIEYFEGFGEAQLQFWWETANAYSDWRGEYWSNMGLLGSPTLVRNDAAADFDWGVGSAAAGLPADGFSTRWTRQVSFIRGVYRFSAQADDGIRVYLDNRLLLNEWHDGDGAAVYTVDSPVEGVHWLIVEYYERVGIAMARFWWQKIGEMPIAMPTATATSGALASSTPTVTETATVTGTPGAFSTPSASTSATASATGTASPTATTTSTGTPVATTTGTPTDTPEPIATPTTAPIDTAEPTATPSATASPTGTDAPGPTYTPTFTTEPSITPTDTPSATLSATPTPTATPLPAIHLSEVLPAPRSVDWDRSGVANTRDEWIELTNGSARSVDLGGSSLDSGPSRGRAYRIPRGTILRPGAYVVFYRRKTNLALDDAYGQVRLLDAAGRLVDSLSYGVLSPDRSISRDALGIWHADWRPSPGAPNLPPPTVTPSATASLEGLAKPNSPELPETGVMNGRIPPNWELWQQARNR
jgi:hypothetical protein